MGKVRGTFIELQPADDAVIGEIFCNARFRYAEMFGELRFERIRTAAARAASQKISDGDAQRLTGFNIVIAGEI